MSPLGLDIRKDILLYALYLEEFIGSFLGLYLGLKDLQGSISFGNTSQSLSFNSKINLLIDLGVVKKGERAKFIAFMEIRNQFMHNLGAKSYVDCFSFLEGKESYILKQYPQSSHYTKEKQLERAVGELTNEVLRMAVRVFEAAKEKAANEITNETSAEFYKTQLNNLLKSIELAHKTIDAYIDRLAEKDSISIKDIKPLGKGISGLVFAHFKKLSDAPK